MRAAPRWITVVVGCAAVAVLAAYVVFSAAARTTHGFVAYYAAARLLIAGEAGPHIYDDEWFRKYVQELTGTGVLEIFGPNPPTMALMATPVGWLDHQTARTTWLFAALVCLALATAALARFAEREGSAVPAAIVALVLLNPAVFANLGTGQAYLFVCALFSGAALSLLSKRDALAGVFLGLNLLFKTSGVAFLVVLVALRQWRAAGTAVLVFVAGALIAAPWIDPGTWLVYPAYVQEFVARPAASVTAYQTTLGFFRHLCVADPVWNPSPAANCAPIALALPPLILATATVITIVLARRAPTALWVAAAVCLSELTLPTAAQQHFASLAVPVILLWPEVSARRSWKWYGVVVLLAALLLVPLDYTAHRFTSGWAALAAYPRLYAAWLLWGATVAAMWSPVRSSAARRPNQKVESRF